MTVSSSGNLEKHLEFMLPEPETQKISKRLSKQVLSNYKPQSPALKKFTQFIHRNKKFLITTHAGADADGLGSEIALYYLLRKLKKDVIILNAEAIPQMLRFMVPENLVQNIQDYEHEWNEALHEVKDYFVLMLDNSEIERTGKVGNLVQEAKLNFVTLDHHSLPQTKNLCIDSTYAATCEMIWDFYHYLSVKIPEEAALALYSGLIADTGNFRFGKTSMRTHLAAGELLSYNFHSDDIYRKLYESHPIDRLRYLQRILKKSYINEKLGYVAAEVRPKTQRGLDLGDSPSEGIVNQLLGVSGIHIAALMTETEEGYLKCSLRSVGNYDVSKIAKEFGGGGHKNAAGLKIFEPYRKARKKVLRALSQTLSGD